MRRNSLVQAFTRIGVAALVTSVVIASSAAHGAPLGTAFTYQGRLKSAGTPLNATADFQFSLWDAAGTGSPPTGGTQIGGTQTVTNVTVAAGLFTVQLNSADEFGPEAFNGQARWLQIAVRTPAGIGFFTPLSPRQEIRAAPYATRAMSVSNLNRHSLDAADGTPADALYVNNDGRVGIGTTDPAARLHVYEQSIAPLLVLSNYNAPAPEAMAAIFTASNGVHALRLRYSNNIIGETAHAALWIEHLGLGGHALVVRDEAADLTPFVITNAGDVGVGTDAPAAKLHVAGNVRVAGNVGIGTANPAALLHAYEQSSAPLLVLSNYDAPAPEAMAAIFTGTNGAHALRLRYSNNIIGETAHAALWIENLGLGGHSLVVRDESQDLTPFVITNAGDVGVGTDAPGAKLHVVGNVKVIGDVEAACGLLTCSDRRYKANIKPVEGALDLVEKLRPVRFDWKRREYPEHQFSDKRQIGFIAQEVEEVLPEVVAKGSDGTYSVDYGRTTPVLVTAIKELKDQVDRNRRQITAQAEEIRRQRHEIESLESRIRSLGEIERRLANLEVIVRQSETVQLASKEGAK